jgi:hypothetical protein
MQWAPKSDRKEGSISQPQTITSNSTNKSIHYLSSDKFLIAQQAAPTYHCIIILFVF